MAKLTPMQQAYQKEIKRLQKAIRTEYKKTGLELDESLIPKMPKRVTQKQLKNIKAIKPKDLREKTDFVDFETGYPLTYDQAVERREQQEIVATPRQINVLGNTINMYFQSIEKWNNTFQSIIHSWIDGLIAEKGEKKVALMLWLGISEGIIVTKEIVYEEDKRQAYMSDMMKFLNIPKNMQAELLGEMEKEIGFEQPL